MNSLDLITQDAVRIVYQPIIALDSKVVIGHEALARGPNMERAQDMLHGAKRIGFLREFELLCLQKAVAMAPEGLLFVNVQPMTLLYLMKKLGPMPIADKIVFEIVEVENLLCDYKEEFVSSIRQLQERGYKIAIDDISSGFNRLELIHLLEPDYIKLDAVLTRGDFYSNVLLKNVVEMAKELKIKTIAECIETYSQLSLISGLGVEYAQGFLLGKPFSPESLPEVSTL